MNNDKLLAILEKPQHTEEDKLYLKTIDFESVLQSWDFDEVKFDNIYYFICASGNMDIVKPLFDWTARNMDSTLKFLKAHESDDYITNTRDTVIALRLFQKSMVGAVTYDQLEVVKLLVNLNKTYEYDFVPKCSNRIIVYLTNNMMGFGKNAINIFCQRGDYEKVELLLSLHTGIGEPQLKEAITQGHLKVLNLIKKYFNQNVLDYYFKYATGVSVLSAFQLVELVNPEKTIEHVCGAGLIEFAAILLPKIANINKTKALETASYRGQVEMVKLLIVFGANKFNESLRALCDRGDNIEIAKILISNGANNFEECTKLTDSLEILDLLKK